MADIIEQNNQVFGNYYNKINNLILKTKQAEKYLKEQMNKYEERFKFIEKNSREKVMNL